MCEIWNCWRISWRMQGKISICIKRHDEELSFSRGAGLQGHGLVAGHNMKCLPMHLWWRLYLSGPFGWHRFYLCHPQDMWGKVKSYPLCNALRSLSLEGWKPLLHMFLRTFGGRSYYLGVYKAIWDHATGNQDAIEKQYPRAFNFMFEVRLEWHSAWHM